MTRPLGTRQHRPWAYAAAAGALALTLTACGGNDSADDPGPTPTTSSAGDASSEPTSPGSSPSASDPFPGVTPASGKQLRQGPVSIHLPPHYEIDRTYTHIVNANDIMAGDQVTFAWLSSFAGSSLDGAARSVLRSQSYGHKPERKPDVTIAGTPFFHFSGRLDSEFYVDKYGAMVRDHLVEITFQMHSKPAQRQKVVESVMASLEIG